MFSSSSSTIPSAPSRYGCWTMIASRHSVLAVNVVSQPVRLRTRPRWSRSHAPDRAARGVGDEQPPSSSNAMPLATRCWEPSVFDAWRPLSVIVIVPGGSPRTSRPTPPARVVGHRLDAEDLLRHAVAADPPHAALAGAAVGDPEVAAAVEGDAVGARHAGREDGRGRRRAGVRAQDHDAAAVGDVEPPVRPEGQPGRVARRRAGCRPRRSPPRTRNTGHGTTPRPGVYRSPRRSAVSPSMPTPAGGLKTVVQRASSFSGRGPSWSPNATPAVVAATAMAASPTNRSMLRSPFGWVPKGDT